jgi:hypothetical protein
MSRILQVLTLLFAGYCTLCSAADQSPATPPPPPPPGPAIDRIIVSVDGASLTGTSGGEGGNVNYLHQEGALLVGVGAEYQRLATSQWGFGSFNLAYSHDMTATARWNVHAEAHEGTGSSVGFSAPFLYSIVAAGVGAALPAGVAADIEERQIDVYTSHGSLPKVSLSKGWGTHLLTSLGYAHSFGGNLNTSYTLARVDIYTPVVNLIAGGDVGRVNPTVINIDGVLTSQARHLNEVFGGVTKPLKRFDVTLLADNIDLAGINRFTVTLSFSVPLQ